MNYLSVFFSVPDDELKQILIAWLTEYRFEGFEETTGGLKAFIPYQLYNEEHLLQLLGRIPENISFQTEIILPKNWNEEWEKNFQPIVIDDEIIIRASFHSVEKYPYEIIIDPKMSFGTGHHETTAMMIQLMRIHKADFAGKTVLDFGSGTGILSILASKLGAKEVLAVDNEEWAYRNCQENFSSNHITNAKAVHGDAKDFSGQNFNIILANINYTILTQHLVEISRALKPRGRLYCSGFLLSDEEGMIVAAEKVNLRLSEKKTNGNWLALSFQNTN